MNKMKKELSRLPCICLVYANTLIRCVKPESTASPQLMLSILAISDILSTAVKGYLSRLSYHWMRLPI